MVIVVVIVVVMCLNKHPRGLMLIINKLMCPIMVGKISLLKEQDISVRLLNYNDDDD